MEYYPSTMIERNLKLVTYDSVTVDLLTRGPRKKMQTLVPRLLYQLAKLEIHKTNLEFPMTF